MKKSQSYIIGFLLNISITFLLVLYSYLWISQIYKSNIDIGKINYVEKTIYDLDSDIYSLYKNGGIVHKKIEGNIIIRLTSNTIELLVPTENVKNTPWYYLRFYPIEDYKKLTPFRDYSIIKRKYTSNYIVYSLNFIPICEGNVCIHFYFNPTRNIICSRNCELTMKKGATEELEKGSETIVNNYIDVDLK